MLRRDDADQHAPADDVQQHDEAAMPMIERHSRRPTRAGVPTRLG